LEWLQFRFVAGNNEVSYISTEVEVREFLTEVGYDVSRKSPEVAVKRFPKVLKWESTWIECSVGYIHLRYAGKCTSRLGASFACLRLAVRSATNLLSVMNVVRSSSLFYCLLAS